MAQNLTRRNAVYYARVAVPKKLQELRSQLGLKGREDVWKSLRTRDLAEAKRALPRTLEGIYRTFDEEETLLRSHGARALVTPSDHDLQVAAWEFIQEDLRTDELLRAQRPSQAEIERKRDETHQRLRAHPPKNMLDGITRDGGVLDFLVFEGAAEMDKERRQILLETLKEHLGANNYVLVGGVVEGLAYRHGWRVEEGTDAYKRLARHLMRAWINSLGTTLKRDAGYYEAATVAPIAEVTAKQGEPHEEIKARKPRRGETLRDYLDQYIREQKAGVSANAKQDLRATIRQFIDCNGDRLVTDYTKSDVAKFKQMLAKTPARAEKLYPDVPLPKVVKLNAQDGHPLLKSNSVRNKLSALSAFGKWLEGNIPGVIASNFATTLPPKKDKSRMEPFTPDEVRAILNASAFVGCQSEQNQTEPGNHKIRDWRYWIPLMLAFTGARLNEIVQLQVADLQVTDGVWTFAITDQGVGQSLKTADSRRLLPIHPTLIDLGILSVRESAEASGQSALFHQIPPNRDGRRSDHAGKWFRKFLRRIGVNGSDDLGGAHRWRHTAADALRRGGVEDYEIAQLLGHAVDVAKMTAHYGRTTTMTTRRRAEIMAKLAYPSVNVALLK